MNLLCCCPQWKEGDIVSQPNAEVLVFKKITSLRKPETTYAPGDYVLVEHMGKKLSVSKQFNKHIEERNTFFGAVVRFELPRGRKLADAKAIISRQPEAVFGRSHFVIPVWKLNKATKEQIKIHSDRATADSPSNLSVVFSDTHTQGPTVRARAVASSEAIKMIAGMPMKQAVVKVFAEGSGR